MPPCPDELADEWSDDEEVDADEAPPAAPSSLLWSRPRWSWSSSFIGIPSGLGLRVLGSGFRFWV